MIRSYSNDELIKIMDAAPLPVQQAIESKTTAATISDLGARLGLHINIIGKIAELNVQMLLGLAGPQEFLKELIAAGVSDKDAQDIMAEITQKIFVPLREKMKNEKIEMPQSVEPMKTVTPPAPPVVERDRTFNNPTPANPMLPRPARVIASMPNYSFQQPSPSQNKNSPPSLEDTESAVRAMKNEKLLEDHEEKHIEFTVAPTPPVLAKTAPRPAVASGVGGPPPPNLPGVLQPPAVPEVKKPTPPAPSVKPYLTDPYREPIDEK